MLSIYFFNKVVYTAADLHVYILNIILLRPYHYYYFYRMWSYSEITIKTGILIKHVNKNFGHMKIQLTSRTARASIYLRNISAAFIKPAGLVLFHSYRTFNVRSIGEMTLPSSQPGDSYYLMPYGLLLEKLKPLVWSAENFKTERQLTELKHKTFQNEPAKFIIKLFNLCFLRVAHDPAACISASTLAGIEMGQNKRGEERGMGSEH